MADALWMRIREVEWAEHPTSDGSNMPSLLRNLASRKLPRAMKASHQMWTALCAGGELYPAAQPSIPFLMEIMGISDPSVQDGILDIFIRIVEESGEGKEGLLESKYQFQRLLRSRDEAVVQKASNLLESLR